MTTSELRTLIQKLYRDLNEVKGREYNRSLPLGDTLLDNRWERAKDLGFGEGASIYDSAIVFGDVSVGENSWIGPQVILDGSGGNLRIGAYCSISAGVHIYTHDTVKWALSGGKSAPNTASVDIGDCCYIGSQSVIAAGVTIGHRSVIAANSFVNCDVPEGTVWGGSPARQLGHVVCNGEDVELVYTK